MQQITITPEELMMLANTLSQKAVDLNNQVNTLGNTVQDMTSIWTGMGSNAYYNYYVSAEQDVRSFAQLIEVIAGEAKAAAQSFDATDEEIAKSLGG